MAYRAYWLALPALVILATFVFLPLASVIRYASWDWSGISDPEFIGWGNIKRMLGDLESWQLFVKTGLSELKFEHVKNLLSSTELWHSLITLNFGHFRNLLIESGLWRAIKTTFEYLPGDPEFWRAFKATLFFALITIPAFLWLSRSIAVAIDGLKFERFIKALLFMPNLITVGGAAIAWYLLYEPDYGFLVEFSRYFTNYLPCEWKSLSLPCYGLALPWRDAPWAGIVYVVLFTLWQIVGYGVLVTSAALKGIPEGSKEAARVDGATERQVRRYIVEPLLRPTLVFLIVIATVFSLQSYTAVFLLTKGAPFGSTRVLGYYLYETSFEYFQLGYGAALTLIIMLLTLVVASLQAWFLSRKF